MFTMGMRRLTLLSALLLLVQDVCWAASRTNSTNSGLCIESTDCGTNEQCIDGECECSDNYTGKGCTVFYDICPDQEVVCYFGGKCVQNEKFDAVTQKYDFYCDCTNAYAISDAVGAQCKNSNFQVCIDGQLASNDAYCLNGGSCKSIVQVGEPIPGCDCPKGFDGKHCEYNTFGSATESQTTSKPEVGRGELSGAMKFYIILIVAAGVLAVVAMVIVIRRRRARAKYQKESVDSLKDLQLGTENVGDTHGLKVEDVEIA